MSLKNNILTIFKKWLKAFFGLCLYGIVLLVISGCKERDEHEGHYTDLTSKENIDSLLGDLNQSTNQTVISSQPTVKVQLSSKNSTIKATGRIVFDERRTNIVATKISGRIEELYVRYNFQYVKKGQAILSLYSPELITYMEQYLMLYKSGRDQGMLNLTNEKLQLLGVTQPQIRQMEKHGKPLQKIVYYSPYEGYIRFGNNKNSAKNTDENMNSGSGMDNMGVTTEKSGPEINSSNSELQPGTYIQEGQTFFSLNDMSQVWAILSIPSQQLLNLKIGIPLKLKVEGNDDILEGSVDFIEPAFESGSKFGDVRVYLHNAQKKLKYNALVSATINSNEGSGFFIPVSAVYSLGRQQIVWLKTGDNSTNNIFKAKAIKTGIEANGKIQVISGLNPGDEVAENAAYLVDREGLISVNP